MPFFRGTRYPLLGNIGSYAQKVLSYGPIAYWPLNELSGTVANCLVNPAQNGTYTGVTLGEPGIGDGNTCPFFDGANDYVNIQTAALAAAFNGAAGTVQMWWYHNILSFNDAIGRRMFYAYVDVNNLTLIQKTGTNANLQADYRAGGVTEQSFRAIAAHRAYFSVFHYTWSASADRVDYYDNGTLYETDTVLGIWAGAPTLTFIGAASVVPTAPYYGLLAHCAIWNRALAPAEIAALAVI